MKIINKFKNHLTKLRSREYRVGFVPDYCYGEKFDYKKVRWIDKDGYVDGWFADPFILNVSEKEIQLLVEEWHYPINRGRISLLTVDADTFKLKEVKEVLTEKFHLSFPYIYNIKNGENDITYVVPESYQSGGVYAYVYDYESRSLSSPQLLVKSPLLDVQILNHNGKFYLMGVENKTEDMRDFNRLEVYESESFLGPYNHIQTLTSDSLDRRGAGQIFRWNNKIIRPSQYCTEDDYGIGVIFKDIHVEGNRYSENDIDMILPVRNMSGGLVLHTYNQNGRLAVIDGNEFVYGKLGRLVEYAVKCFKRIAGTL